MMKSATIANQPKAAKRWALIVWFFVLASALLFLSWWSFPPPLLKGFPRVVLISYFIALMGVFVFSFIWLIKFDKVYVADAGGINHRKLIWASLVASMVAFACSAIFIMLVGAVSGLFNMI